MRSKSFIFISLLFLFLFQGCKYFSKNSVSIEGKLANASEKKLYIFLLQTSGSQLIDSTSFDDSGNFRIDIPVKSTGFYLVKLNAANEITLIVSPGEKIYITGNANALRNTYHIKGSENSSIYSEYELFTINNLKQVDSLSAVFAESRSNPDFVVTKQKLDSAYIHIFNMQKENVISFVSNHMNSIASLLAISNNFGPNTLLTEQSHPELFLSLDSALANTYPENEFVNAFHRRMLVFKAELADKKAHESILKPGNPVPEIALQNSDGKEIKLSSFKGKITLVYFWSSWNALSRQTNMNLNRIYSLYHKRGFEIYAVSIDSDTELWKNAYLLDKAYWVQVHDPKGLESEYSKIFAVRAIPKMILLSREGKIISSQAEFQQLDELITKNL